MTNLSATPLPTLPARRRHSHKGDYGRVLIVGGSLGMAGAPALAARACLRSGAGVVSVGTPRCVQPTVASFAPEHLTHAWPDDGECLHDDSAEPLLAACRTADAVALGPGIGRSAAVGDLTRRAWTSSPTPMVFDADGLHALADLGEAAEPAGPRIVTPHAGEFARLAGEPLSDPDDDAERVERAAALARRLGRDRSRGEPTIVLLKGPRTVVTDGERYAVNPTGNPGMATGGAGDVLTGTIAGLVGQGLSIFDAARLGAHAHGLAGDLAAAKLGEVALVAGDLIDHLPAAWKQLT